MSSRPPIPKGLAPTPSHTDFVQGRYTHKYGRDLDRALPPLPATSLPNNYEIPSLRRKEDRDQERAGQSGHSRSASHPISSFFSGGKRSEKKNNAQNDEPESSDGLGSSRENTRKAKPKPSKEKENANKQPTTGKCMTCDSTVRWPADLKVFRCTTCLTINDLEPSDGHSSNDGGARDGPSRRPMPISTDRTRTLIDRCIDSFFHRLLEQDLRSAAPILERPDSTVVSDDEDDSAKQFTLPLMGLDNPPILPPRPRFQDRSPSEPSLSSRSRPAHPNDPPQGSPQRHRGALREDTTTQRPQRPQPPAPLRRTYSSGPGDASNDVFRMLESYVGAAFTGCTSLNSSFFTIKPTYHKEEKRPQPPHVAKISVDQVPVTPSDQEVVFSELDAKTLLIGDFVENGMWWTGNSSKREDVLPETTRERSPERGRGIVSAKTPRINWLELAEWYRLILHAGEDWRRRWSSYRSSIPETEQCKWEAVPMEHVQRIMHDSQIHLQRTLLKATENLLKRPRRPLKAPEDCRFLLMLMANPLLAPSNSRHGSKTAAYTSDHTKKDSSHNSAPASKPQSLPVRQVSGLGHHSGIIKRILGLLSNLSNDTHLYLSSWLSRFSDAHFSTMVDIVSSFVTYRLAHQASKPVQERVDPTAGLIPSFSSNASRHASQLHAAIDTRPKSAKKKQELDGAPKLAMYSEDWQIRSAARVMALLFQANTGHATRRRDTSISPEQRSRSAGLNAKHQAQIHGQIVPISNFYNSILDHTDLEADFKQWEGTKTKFTFCQYPFFLSIWAKIYILDLDAKRQMEIKAREAFFDSIMTRKAVSQFFVLKVRRECLVEDSLKNVSEAIGKGGSDLKKGLKIDFVDEEGVDAGGLRKEWFLLAIREIFNPDHGLFTYDEDSQYCYFNPYCFESSEQFFLVGILLGLAIHNSTILDVAFPPFVFKKLLASAPQANDKLMSTPKVSHHSSLEDLAEWRPSLARGLRQLLEFEGDVEEVFCRDFVAEVERYGEIVQIPLVPGGSHKPVTNQNRREFVDLYVHHLLETSVARQYEPFKRGFFTVCGGNALSLFRPEEIELLVRGSDEPLDVTSLKAVATYDGWPKDVQPETQPQVEWFWDFFQRATPGDQRSILSFITGSDRIPAMGATNLVIRIVLLEDREADLIRMETQRFPIARTCFNSLGLYQYHERATLEHKLWAAVTMSEGFGLK